MPRVIRSPEWILSWKPNDSRCSWRKEAEPQLVGDLLADPLGLEPREALENASDQVDDDDQAAADPQRGRGPRRQRRQRRGWRVRATR